MYVGNLVREVLALSLGIAGRTMLYLGDKCEILETLHMTYDGLWEMFKDDFADTYAKAHIDMIGNFS